MHGRLGVLEFLGLLMEWRVERMVIDGSFLLGSLAGEVLFAEVLITPTGVSKGCGCVLLPHSTLICLMSAFHRIVEFASQEDAQRAIRELSEQTLLGRPVFIREVCIGAQISSVVTSDVISGS